MRLARVPPTAHPAALARRTRARTLLAMSIERLDAARPPGPALERGQLEPSAPRMAAVRGDRLRSAIVWAGLATLAALSLLAAVHLLLDLSAVLGIRGGWSSVGLRLLPVAVLLLAGLLLAVLVVWLAGAGRRSELLATAIGVLVLVVVRVFLSSQLDSGRLGEPGVYLAMAESFLGPDSDFMGRPMAYSAVLAAGFALTADRQLAIEAVNLLLALLAGGVVLGMARGLYGARAGALALLGYALWPAGALMTVVSIPQVAFDLAVAASAWAAVGAPPGWRGGALTGALLGLAQYLRPTTPAFLPAFVLARLWPGAGRGRLAAAILVPVGAFLLVLAPVVVYNVARTGTPSISTSDYGGHTLYIGTDIETGGQFSEAANDELVRLAGPDLLARSELGTAIALQRIREDPLGIAGLAVRKQDTLWGTEHFGVQYGIRQSLADRPQHPDATTPLLLSQGFYCLVLLGATAGVWLLRARPDALVPLVIALIWTVSAIHALLEVRDRHHAYVVPLLLPLAALALVTLADRVAGRRPRSGRPDAIH